MFHWWRRDWNNFMEKEMNREMCRLMDGVGKGDFFSAEGQCELSERDDLA